MLTLFLVTEGCLLLVASLAVVSTTQVGDDVPRAVALGSMVAGLFLICWAVVA